jgi:succinyl-diaminopimelate desuccinylase
MDEEQQVALLKRLIQCKSVTPSSEEPIDLIIDVLSGAGFECNKLQFADDTTGDITTNLYACAGTGAFNLCFAGHVDVVPIGDENSWTCDPFAGEVKGSLVYGRGAVDMKGGLTASIAAALRFISEHSDPSKYKLSFLITGDEEWESKNGTVKMIDWLQKNNHSLSACVIGEPTSRRLIGDTVKNGSRGSLLFQLEVDGVQGHVAYNKNADNPITRLVNILYALKQIPLDNGSKFFEPSNLEVTDIQVGNHTSNLIPSKAQASFCIRFNDQHSAESLIKIVETTIQKHAHSYSLKHKPSGDAYIVGDKWFIDTVADAVRQVQRIEPEISAHGATSDARFIKDLCPVIELGPNLSTAHKVDEHISLEDLFAITRIYYAVIKNFFTTPRSYNHLESFKSKEKLWR